MASTEQVIKDFIVQEFGQSNPVAITDDTRLVDEEVIDSLGIFLLVNFLQDRFGVEIGPEEVTLENFESVSAITELVEAKRVDSTDHA